MCTQPPDKFMVSVSRGGISLDLLQNRSMGRIVRHSSHGLALCMQNDTWEKPRQRYGKEDSWNQVCVYHWEHPDKEAHVTSPSTREQWGEGDLSYSCFCFRCLKMPTVFSLKDEDFFIFNTIKKKKSLAKSLLWSRYRLHNDFDILWNELNNIHLG